jgi:hypothetical protein
MSDPRRHPLTRGKFMLEGVSGGETRPQQDRHRGPQCRGANGRPSPILSFLPNCQSTMRPELWPCVSLDRCGLDSRAMPASSTGVPSKDRTSALQSPARSNMGKPNRALTGDLRKGQSPAALESAHKVRTTPRLRRMIGGLHREQGGINLYRCLGRLAHAARCLPAW